jgi:hypothetical protein
LLIQPGDVFCSKCLVPEPDRVIRTHIPRAEKSVDVPDVSSSSWPLARSSFDDGNSTLRELHDLGKALAGHAGGEGTALQKPLRVANKAVVLERALLDLQGFLSRLDSVGAHGPALVPEEGSPKLSQPRLQDRPRNSTLRLLASLLFPQSQWASSTCESMTCL